MPSQTIQNKLHEFHTAFGCPSTKDKDDFNILRLAESLITEEYHEVLEAIDDWSAGEDTVARRAHLLKELADLAYVCVFFAEVYGWNFDVGFNRVHKSNMSKLGADGKPIRNETGKVVKGPNYKEPNLEDLV